MRASRPARSHALPLVAAHALLGALLAVLLLALPARALAGDPTGPDVVVSDITSALRLASEGGVSAYALGSESCNVGDAPVTWEATTPAHPIKGQSLFRYMDGRFEMLGMGWLLHGFCALDVGGCGDCDPRDCASLGAGCATTNSAGIQGSQVALGPRYEVNGSTGAFPFPPTSPPITSSLDRRLQVAESDIDPASNPGASYFVEVVQIGVDEIAAGGGANRASHRPVSFGAAPAYAMSVTDATIAGTPAIEAWRELDPEVRLTTVPVDDGGAPDGDLIVGSRCTPNGDGTWHYEIAVYNLSSHRAVGSVEIPLPEGIAATNVGFHDVDYHSGAPIEGTDWPVTTTDTSIAWATTPFDENPNANAIRWSTLYNFRFDAAAPPTTGLGALGLFRPGTPDEVLFETCVPSPLRVAVTADATEVVPGGRLELEVVLENLSTATVATEGWLDATKPSGAPYPGNPIVGPKSATLDAGRTVRRTFPLRVPASVPPSGPYTVTVKVGTFPDDVLVDASLQFDVVEE